MPDKKTNPPVPDLAPPGTGQWFTCGLCGRRFEGAWTDAAARAETRANFGRADPGDVVVCDPCYRQMIRLVPPRSWRPRPEAERER